MLMITGPDEPPDELRTPLRQVCRALDVTNTIHPHELPDCTALEAACANLGSGDSIAVYLAAQNAAVIIRRSGHSVIFETFETSARSADVLAATTALQWSFPGTAVAITYEIFRDQKFQRGLCRFFHQSSHETVLQFVPLARKGGISIAESRDTVDPALISSMLTVLLSTLPDANNHRYQGDPPFTKRVRDDVCHGMGELPWRRSAFYLVLRVAVHRQLQVLLGSEKGRHVYKAIMCLFLRKICQSMLESKELLPEHLALARSKLARRVAKLVIGRNNTKSVEHSILTNLLTFLENRCRTTIDEINTAIEGQWALFKHQARRTISKVPKSADEKSLCLSLSHSRTYLFMVIEHAQFRNGHQASVTGQGLRNKTLSPCDWDRNSYMTLNRKEEELKLQADGIINTTTAVLSPVSVYADAIQSYLEQAPSYYRGCSEGNSLMLLTVIEQWVLMDKAAVMMFPLLESFDIPFREGFLNALHLPSYTDMCRLERVEHHMYERRRRCTKGLPSILADPSAESFPVRYFNQDEGLQALRDQILQESEQQRRRKQQELQTLTQKYNKLEEKINGSECDTVTMVSRSGIETHDAGKCQKCQRRRSLRNMKIDVCEDLLPEDPVHQKTICFELRCPAGYAVYRDVTWKIIFDLSLLAEKSFSDDSPARVLLRGYNSLAKYGQGRANHLTLASTTKLFSRCHYQDLPLPCNVSQLYMPSGLTMRLYDCQRGRWVAPNQSPPSVAILCSENIPATSPMHVLEKDIAWSVDTNQPFPNAVVADQTKCPKGANIGEFHAFQELLFGNSIAAIGLLRELASVNLNFSSPATTVLVARTILQAGPRNKNDPLRIKHWVYRDSLFCAKLLEQVRLRITAIARNWRESQCVDCMLTIVLRILEMAKDEETTIIGRTILSDIRHITRDWMRVLREQIMATDQHKIFEQRRRDLVQACLLLRRTLHAEVMPKDVPSNPAAVEAFLESSIILQQSLDESLTSMTPILRNALIRDWRFLSQLRPKLELTILSQPDVLSRAITNVWSVGPNACLDNVQSWLTSGEGCYRATTFAPHGYNSQSVEFSLISGALFIDDRPLGKIPMDYRLSAVLKDLFGDLPLWTYPSSLQGMDFVLALPFNGHHIHIGLRNEQSIVQAKFQETLFELVPRDIFHGPKGPDLPGNLVQGHYHWLDLKRKLLHVRPNTDKWEQKPSHWILDLQTCIAKRHNDSLVDPHSLLFGLVTHNFIDFEDAFHMIVYQPKFESLSVQLVRLDLRFEVNKRGLLQSAELKAEIDPNQDAGTWYGFQSKIVLRDTTNPRLRSMMIPLGEPCVKRVGVHVAIVTNSSGQYGKYTINEVLGRLDCAAEPTLIYLRIQYHALTSFVLADPLTRRSGTQEALRYLRSATSQPWNTLNEHHLKILTMIAGISPSREYYPTHLKCLQWVTWDETFTSTIQSDEFKPLVEDILQRGASLAMFHSNQSETPEDSSKYVKHLVRRAICREQLYSCRQAFQAIDQGTTDEPYHPRDRSLKEPGSTRATEILHHLNHWSSEIYVALDLKATLEDWSDIEGFVSTHEGHKIADTMNADMKLHWASMVNFCRKSNKLDKYDLLFFFGPLSFSQCIDINVVRLLLAYALFDELKAIPLPDCHGFRKFVAGEQPTSHWLRAQMESSRIPAEDQDWYQENILTTQQQREARRRRVEMHEKESNRQLTALVNVLLTKWPSPALPERPPMQLSHVDLRRTYDRVRTEWLRLAQNFELSKYVDKVEGVLKKYMRKEPLQPSPSVHCNKAASAKPRCPLWMPNHDDIISSLGSRNEISLSEVPSDECFVRALVSRPPHHQAGNVHATVPEAAEAIVELRSLILPLVSSSNRVRHQYGSDLERSLGAFERSSEQSANDDANLRGSMDLTQLTCAVESGLSTISSNLSMFAQSQQTNTVQQWLVLADVWPQVSPTLLLDILSTGIRQRLPAKVVDALVRYAIDITTVQRLIRLETQLRADQRHLYTMELANMGHTNWNPRDHLPWLLLEVEADFLIRPKQIEVAKATMHPKSGSNSVLQMNMGDGKSSCIIPMVAAALADGQTLLRVVVPKALLPQMAQTLQSRLGGILNQVTTHVPFSRHTPTTENFTDTFRRLHQQTLERSGVILTLPEHILSFKLSGLQSLSDGRLDEARTLMEIQRWLAEKSRDVLDESDHTLSPTTQLIYPSGAQNVVDGHPHRWTTVQVILQLVQELLPQVRKSYPQGLEIDQRPGHPFSAAYFLDKGAENYLLQLVAKRLCSGYGDIISSHKHSRSIIEGVRKFISDPGIKTKLTMELQRYFEEETTAWNNLLLIRGLLVHRILILGLKKRWNVQYGLHPLRDPISVPFHAKGKPSETAEWGHPDVAILLTCLSFYYAGITLAQLQQCLSQILRSDNRVAEYDRWLHGKFEIPDSLKDVNALNLDDEARLMELWQCFRYNITAIDFFTNNFGFPKHAKQFEYKLQTSGWDIPLGLRLPPAQLNSADNSRQNTFHTNDGDYTDATLSQSVGFWKSPSNDHQAGLTTGFSGTNDNRTLLPLTIQQVDLPGLLGTNAEVLMYLLKKRNRCYVQAIDTQGRRLSEQSLLALLTAMKIRVLIDAGAQILEHGNRSLVELWMAKDRKAQAAVYFNEQDKAMVYSRKGFDIPLLASPYAASLDGCLIYLDEAHTRGTDLKLPPDARGALTLGPGQTKDHTVQGRSSFSLPILFSSC